MAFFAFGMAKKILIANPMGHVADTAFAAGSLHALDAWFGLVGYAFQIYFDFSGYSDMACGLALMLGFVLIQNFDSPYQADSITDFWRRWHISLSTWLRDYLYIPLGGNRLGTRRTYVNLMAVMLFGGLWHGASWNFVLWGAIHGGMLAFERAQGKASFYRRLPRPVRVGITFFVVCLSWVFFRAKTLGQAVGMFKSCLAWPPLPRRRTCPRARCTAACTSACSCWRRFSSGRRPIPGPSPTASPCREPSPRSDCWRFRS